MKNDDVEFVYQIATQILSSMKEKGIKPNHITTSSNISKTQLYAVLRMGTPTRPNYSISTLLKVLVFLNLKIEIKEAEKK